MALSPLPALDRTSPTFKTDLDAYFLTALPAFSTEANALQADVAANQSTASTAATTATTQAGNAATSATTASDSAITATTQAELATTQAGNSATSATAASGSAATATTQAGIATTKAGEALASASAAAASAVSIAGGPVASINGMTGVVTGIATGTGTASGTNTGDQDLSGKQDVLVSGTSIKTINSVTVLGSGNIVTGDVTLASAQTLTNKTIGGATNNVEARSLKSATTSVSVSAATAPTSGQVLTATSGTAASWQALPAFPAPTGTGTGSLTSPARSIGTTYTNSGSTTRWVLVVTTYGSGINTNTSILTAATVNGTQVQKASIFNMFNVVDPTLCASLSFPVPAGGTYSVAVSGYDTPTIVSWSEYQ